MLNIASQDYLDLRGAHHRWYDNAPDDAGNRQCRVVRGDG